MPNVNVNHKPFPKNLGSGLSVNIYMPIDLCTTVRNKAQKGLVLLIQMALTVIKIHTLLVPSPAWHFHVWWACW